MFRRTEDFRNFPKIYIPLCLYLYLLLSGLVSATGLHLHSTMFIFILISQSVQLFLLPIYIPLCLYLYHDHNMLYIYCKQIYIPLCLYLYAIFCCDFETIVDIYIPLCLYLYS